MSDSFKKLPDIPDEEQTPFVQDLIQIIMDQQEMLREFQDEILRLKGQKSRPKISPSKMDESTSPDDDTDNDETDDNQRGSSAGNQNSSGNQKKTRKPKRSKTANLKIDQTKKIKADHPPEATFKGYKEFVVQDIILETSNTRYLLEQWQMPEGGYIIAKVPDEFKGGHFGPDLISYVIDKHFGQRVTQPRLLEHLGEIGVQISAGQLSRILTTDQHGFHEEKDSILQAGKECSQYLQTDDTGARHKGKNGYCTFIGNELFSWFQSTESKSRINFLELLSGNNPQYVLNTAASEYMATHNFPKQLLSTIESERTFNSKESWEQFLEQNKIISDRNKKIATEGALIGGLLASGLSMDFPIVSDDAGQFNVFDHVLCWIHAERSILKLVPFRIDQQQAVEWVRTQIWDLYADLKTYKLDPEQNKNLVEEIRDRFDEMCITRTCYPALNEILIRFSQNKHELLRVLEKPFLPLHNNLSESDIREYVQKRKISGGTRSDEGRRCRDTFISLRKTCRKHGISFWEYLKDRIAGLGKILPLSEVICKAAQAL